MQRPSLREVDHASSIGRLGILPFEIRQHIFCLVLEHCYPGISVPAWRFMPFAAFWKRSPAPLLEDLTLAIISGTFEGFLPSIFELGSYRVEDWSVVVLAR